MKTIMRKTFENEIKQEKRKVLLLELLFKTFLSDLLKKHILESEVRKYGNKIKKIISGGY